MVFLCCAKSQIGTIEEAMNNGIAKGIHAGSKCEECYVSLHDDAHLTREKKKKVYGYAWKFEMQRDAEWVLFLEPSECVLHCPIPQVGRCCSYVRALQYLVLASFHVSS
jgi:hypothetical protein